MNTIILLIDLIAFAAAIGLLIARAKMVGAARAMLAVRFTTAILLILTAIQMRWEHVFEAIDGTGPVDAFLSVRHSLTFAISFYVGGTIALVLYDLYTRFNVTKGDTHRQPLAH